MATRCSTAADDGVREAADWLHEHPARNDAALASMALATVAAPPNADGTRAEHAFIRRIVDQRTPAGDATAVYHSRNGAWWLWSELTERYAATVGPQQAAYATRLLHDAANLSDAVTARAKDAYHRVRPCKADPTLPAVPGTIPPAGYPGADAFAYPSGHASGAFAGATVLGHLMPERAAEFRAMAEQVSFARVYSAVHHPSDVIAGARIGALIATAVVGATPAPPPGS